MECDIATLLCSLVARSLRCNKSSRVPSDVLSSDDPVLVLGAPPVSHLFPPQPVSSRGLLLPPPVTSSSSHLPSRTKQENPAADKYHFLVGGTAADRRRAEELGEKISSKLRTLTAAAAAVPSSLIAAVSSPFPSLPGSELPAPGHRWAPRLGSAPPPQER
nr:unnamed protein product [Digitaria exilis]